MDTPGRSCPTHYRYTPKDLSNLCEQDINQTVYVIGGLYGNHLALNQILALRQLDNDPTLIFNGDFNWFNKSCRNFQEVNTEVFKHFAIAGNVEKELVNPDDSIGCGCAYPEWVDDETVARSNKIIKHLQSTAINFPEILSKLDDLPVAMRVKLGRTRVLILHGDPESLAGWGLSYELLREPSHRHKLENWFEQTQVEIICCTHTCLPAIKRIVINGREKLIINNGAAGMGNLKNDSCGLMIRISSNPNPIELESSNHTTHNNLFIDLIKIHFNDELWQHEFLKDWPVNSPAYESYFSRIKNGTNLSAADIIL